MVDWLHCNICFNQPGDGLKFSLTSCGHIYCERCVLESCKEKCKMCGSSYDIIPLTSKLKPEVEMYFTEPLDLLKKNFKQVLQVMDFQRNHRRRYISYIRDKIAKHQSMEEKTCKAIEQTRDMDREIMRLKEENSYLKRLIYEKGIGIHSTRTMSTPGRSQTSTLSPIRKGSSESPGQIPHYPRGLQSSFQSPFQLLVDRITPSLTSKMVSQSSVVSMEPIVLRNSDKKYSIFAGTCIGAMQISQYKMIQSAHGHNSGIPASVSGRLSIRTPPSGGRIGTVAGTPSPKNVYSQQVTPKSVPHPIMDFSSFQTPPVDTR